MQSVLRAIYPPACMGCGDMTEVDHALCGACWRETPFLGGALCDLCARPLPGEAEPDLRCDACLATPPPWGRARAVLQYRDGARRLVLGLKHSDRTDLARPMGLWMARAAADLAEPDTLVVPVPLHRGRLWRRRYNQSALLAARIARALGRETCADALWRHRATATLGGQDAEARRATLDGAIRPHPRRGARMGGRMVLLVDDVLTSGATLGACARAARAAGARAICVVALARAAPDP